MSWFLNFCWRTDLRKKQLFRIPSRLSRWTWCRPLTPDAVPATHSALVPASALQCCTSFSTSLGGGWRCASNHRGPCWCVMVSLSNEHPPPRLASQRPILLDMTSVDTVTQWREDWSSASVVNHTVVTDLLSDGQVSVSLVMHGLWWTVYGQVWAHVMLICTSGVVQSPSCDCGRRWADKIWRWTESTPRSGWWCSRMAGVYSDCSTREIMTRCSEVYRQTMTRVAVFAHS